MDPPAEPPPPNSNPWESTPTALPPDIPAVSYRYATRPSFPAPDPIRAADAGYFPTTNIFEQYINQLQDGLQTLIQGPLDYRLTSFLNTWSGSDIGIHQTEFDTATRLVTAALDAGPRANTEIRSPLEASAWGTLASSCLAAIARGFTRPLAEVSHKTYIAEWEQVADNPQKMLEDGENPEFHSLLQRLKATIQHVDIHLNSDEENGLRKWTATVQKEIEESARRLAMAEVEEALCDWKNDQLTIRQQQLEAALKRTLLERNMDLFRSTANELGLTIGNPSTIPPSRPTPITGNKRTISGSTPQPIRAATFTPMPSVPDATPPLMPTLDVVTLTAAVQTAMQPFMARLAAIERSAPATNNIGSMVPQQNRAQAEERTRPAGGQPRSDQQRPTTAQPASDEGWTQTSNRRKKGKANPVLQQVNLTPRSYATAAASPAPDKPGTQNQQTSVANPPPAFTEVTIIRNGGAILSAAELAIRKRQPDAIVREVRANMARDVARPLPIISGRWSSGARSKGNFVFTMRGQVDFAFVQTFEHFLVGPFPGGGQLCPNQGWTKLLAHGVPILDNDGTVFGPEDLLQEVRTMQGLRNVYFSSLPRWIKPVGQLTFGYTSLTFAFSDPDGGTTKQLLTGKQALFGKQVQIERWVDKPLLVQCGRCHALGHAASSKACRLPRDSIKCYICGKGHLADTHDRECPRSKQHKMAGSCDCRVQCLTCNTFGHNARDRACPSRNGYRSRKSRPNTKGKNVEHGPTTHLPDEVPTQRPDPPTIPEAPTIPDPTTSFDEEMLELDDYLEPQVPRNFLPGPGLSPEEAFEKMKARAGQKLAEAGMPIPFDRELTYEDRDNHDFESQRRMLVDREVTPEEAAEADRFDLAEAVTNSPMGYFYPGMPDARQTQLSAIISAGTPDVVDQNTPGLASTSTASV